MLWLTFLLHTAAAVLSTVDGICVCRYPIFWFVPFTPIQHQPNYHPSVARTSVKRHSGIPSGVAPQVLDVAPNVPVASAQFPDFSPQIQTPQSSLSSLPQLTGITEPQTAGPAFIQTPQTVAPSLPILSHTSPPQSPLPQVPVISQLIPSGLEQPQQTGLASLLRPPYGPAPLPPLSHASPPLQPPQSALSSIPLVSQQPHTTPPPLTGLEQLQKTGPAPLLTPLHSAAPPPTPTPAGLPLQSSQSAVPSVPVLTQQPQSPLSGLEQLQKTGPTSLLAPPHSSAPLPTPTPAGLPLQSSQSALPSVPVLSQQPQSPLPQLPGLAEPQTTGPASILTTRSVPVLTPSGPQPLQATKSALAYGPTSYQPSLPQLPQSQTTGLDTDLSRSVPESSFMYDPFLLIRLFQSQLSGLHNSQWTHSLQPQNSPISLPLS